MKVAIINGNTSYHNMFRQAGFQVVFAEVDADLLCFTGGADVTPSYYGEERHPYTQCDPQRDAIEKKIFDTFKGQKKMVGICRGGQFLNVMCGGRLWQDVNNHGISKTHKAQDIDTGEIVDVTSTHHQMMIPGPGAEVLCMANESTYKECVSDGNIIRVEDGTADTEALHYDGEVLCFQPHPEFFGASSTRDYFFQLLNRVMGAKV